jgi:hypothetical protein
VRDPARVAVPHRGGFEGDASGWTDADDAAARHPAGRGKGSGSRERPKGPYDDPEFLCALEAAIRRNPPVS